MYDAPRISVTAAHILSGTVASAYVLSLYLTAPKSNKPQWRNDISVIKRRLRAASLSTLGGCLLLAATLWATTPPRHFNKIFDVTNETFVLLGLATHYPLTAHFVTPLLFLGPLYSLFLSESLPSQTFFDVRRDVVEKLLSWFGIRNFLVGPLTEEVTYRGCVLAFLHLAGVSRTFMIFVSPCWFGLAHVHHGYETYVRYGRTATAIKRALIGTFFQFAYTTLFGWYCSYLFLSTGSLIVPFFAHVFCNAMGLPQIGYELQQHPHRKAHIVTAYIVGIIGFIFTLKPWTHSQNVYWPMS